MCGCSRRWHSHREVLSRVSTCFILPLWDDRIKTSSTPLRSPPIRLSPFSFTASHNTYTHALWPVSACERDRISANQEARVGPRSAQFFQTWLPLLAELHWSGTVVSPLMDHYSALWLTLFRLCHWFLDLTSRLQMTVPVSLACLAEAGSVF